MLLVLVFLLFYVHTTCCQSQCTQDCSVASKHYSDGTYHNISCSIQSYLCSSNGNSTPASPFHKPNGNQWYLYPDPYRVGYQRVALNFSWGPKQDSSVEYLQGYKIKLIAHGLRVLKFFCINEKLHYLKHLGATFYYDCFGSEPDTIISPDLFDETKLIIQIRSLPLPLLEKSLHDQELSFQITIPSCDDTRLSDVYECAQMQNFTLSLGNISCQNRSVEVFYNIPSFFGFRRLAWFSPVRRTKEQEKLKKFKPFHIMPSKGMLVLHLPENQGFDNKYFVSVWGNQNKFRMRRNFNFSHCILTEHKFPLSLTIVLLSMLVFFIIILAVAGLYLHWNEKLLTRWRQQGERSCTNRRNAGACPIQAMNAQAKNLQRGLESVTVYVIFVDDHPKHRKAVIDFVNYLHGDLNFNVIFELFQTAQISADPVTWMEKSLAKSDKVIVIWSPGAARKWHMYNNMETGLEQDLFTPVLKQIKKDIFRDKNVGKYYFGYFEYSTKDDIPDLFKKTSVIHFKLMKQFEELYFRLRGMEMYMPGAVIRKEEIAFDRYFDPKLNAYGPILETSICEMCAYVKENPDWHSKQYSTGIIDLSSLGLSSANELMDVDILPSVSIDNRNNHTITSEAPKCCALILSRSMPVPESDAYPSIEYPSAYDDNCKSYFFERQHIESDPHSYSHGQMQDSGFQSALSAEATREIGVKAPILSHGHDEHNIPKVDKDHSSFSDQFPMFNGLPQQQRRFSCTIDPFDAVNYDEQVWSDRKPLIWEKSDAVSPLQKDKTEKQLSMKLVPLDMESDAMDTLTAINNLASKSN